MTTYKVYFVSDQTGVTVETLGHSLLEQFENKTFDTVTVPFVDTVDKAERVAEEIRQVAENEGRRPIVFASLVQENVRAPLLKSGGLVLDFFEAYLGALEQELGSQSSHTLRRHHGIYDSPGYNLRIEATNFA
ncbi:MAG: kinase/pyrophosphorylase, partial [Gammaproteobacteria bacterium]|nr:kinase/pyrophosphorylase [Gammaproteobacteria bacterium]